MLSDSRPNSMWRPLSAASCFVDRFGCAHVPFTGAEVLAKHLAQSQPDAVFLYIEGLEQEYKAQGYAPGAKYMHDFLREQQPAFALARQWAGIEAEVEELRTEIERLRSVAFAAIHDLEAEGLRDAARRVRRALDGR
jgi:hypothetical protein